jgi:hypothetical protein
MAHASSETSLLESVARDLQTPIATVVALFERERDALSQDATITNYISLLALRRVRYKLQQSSRQH